MADGTMLDPNSIPVEGADLQGMQVDGGYATPPNEVDFSSLYFSQVDGADDETEAEAAKSQPQPEPAQEAQGQGPAEAGQTGQPEAAGGPSEHVPDELEPMETSGSKETEAQATGGKKNVS